MTTPMRPNERENANLPNSTAGRGLTVRVSATDLGSLGCPDALAVKVRPARRRRPRERSAWRSFTLGPLMDALDRVEFAEQDDEAVVDELVRSRGTFGAAELPAHPGLVSWTVEAFRNFRAAWRSHQSAAEPRCPRPVRSPWVIVHEYDIPDHRGVRRYEQTCWGRRYESEDGSVREVWLLGFTVPGKRTPVVATAAANVVAFGGPEAPERVRVVEFGGGSAKAEQLADWTVEQVRHRAKEQVWPKLHTIVDGAGHRPGRDCTSCVRTADCTGLPVADLLPDLPAVDGPRRDLSVTDLRIYQSCPARYHLLRQLRVRDAEIVENQAITTGRAVDAALRARHASGSQGRRCGADEPQDESVVALPEQSRWSARRMLAHHSTLCPFPDVEAYHAEPRNHVVVHDERLRVVFIAEPDLLYPRWGGWVWRETKTSIRELPRDRPLLRQVPQLAMAVLLLASGTLGRDITRSRVELEQLRPDGCALEELDPGSPAVVAESREVIGDLVSPLLTDAAYHPTPGWACVGCEVRRWCAPGSQHVAERKEVPTP